MEKKNLAYCESCKHKSFDPKMGIVCGLTGIKPWFEINCNNFLIEDANYSYACKSVNEGLLLVDTKKRFLHYIVDSVSLIFIMSKLIPFLINDNPFVYLLSLVFVLYAYYFFAEFYLQKTVGKMLTKTIVLDAQTLSQPTFIQIAIRSFFRLPFVNFIDSVSFLMGLNLHDTVSKTSVFNNDEVIIGKARILLDLNGERYKGLE